jgi:hypothetical protein
MAPGDTTVGFTPIYEELAGGREEQAQQAASAEKPRHLFFKFCRFPETRGF